MRLKIRLLKWSAGLPVAMLHKKTADKIGLHEKDRIFIKTLSKRPKYFSSIIDTVDGLVKKNEIVVSSELKKNLGLKKGQSVEVGLSLESKSLFLVKRKLDGFSLAKGEVKEIVSDIVTNSLSEPEVALFISAMYKSGMSFKETVYLIEAILETGNKLVLKSKYVVDKHSIGGIAGNRTTPIVVSICAADGLVFPKTSSRAITSAAGTADVMETLAKIEFSISDLKRIIGKTNACLVWGGSLGIVPADSKIIKIEKVLKIDPKAQLLASIMSKKIALGGKYILIDIPYGKYAKVNKSEALRLKRDFERLGKYFKRKLVVVLTKGDEPIGNGIGPALELIDILKILGGDKSAPKDLEEKSLFLAGKLFEMTGKVKKGKGYDRAKEILSSGKALEKFNEIVKAQGGEIKDLKMGEFRKDVFVKKSGRVKEINNGKMNMLARIAGCPVDKFSGVYLYSHVGDSVKKGDKLVTIYSGNVSRVKEAIKFYNRSSPIRVG